MDISTNILSTIQAGLITSTKLLSLNPQTDPAGLEASQLAASITLLTSTLKQIHLAITQEGGGRYKIGAVAILQAILERCGMIYGKLDGLSDRFYAQDRKAKKGHISSPARDRDESEKIDVKIMKGTLEVCHITLHLMQHNLLTSKQSANERRYSSLSAPIEDPQQQSLDLVCQTLHGSRQSATTILEKLEDEARERKANSLPSLQSSSSLKSTNKLRKLKLKPPTRGDEARAKNAVREIERASEWIKDLVRLERNNALFTLEFVPGGMEMRSGDGSGRGFGFDEGAEGDVRTERDTGAMVGELQGDGPDDLPHRKNERMEYTRGWPGIYGIRR